MLSLPALVALLAGSMLFYPLGRQQSLQHFVDTVPFMRYTLPVNELHAQLLVKERCYVDLIRMPNLLARFDWVYGHETLSHVPDRLLRKDPRTVYAAPDSVHRLLDVATRTFDPGQTGRVVVFANRPEWPLSQSLGENETHRAATLAKLQEFFGTIFHQFRDVDIAAVRPMPVGLNSCQLGPRDPRSLLAVMARASTEEAAKPRHVLASWGLQYACLEYGTCPYSSGTVGGKVAAASRSAARRWAQSAAARELGVELRPIAFEDYFQELARYKFLISPLGFEISTAKMIEALLTLTVPIVERDVYGMHDDLKGLGFPIVVVDGWAQITAPRLAGWWSGLAPRLRSFRQRCLTPEGYWNMIVGEMGYCP